MLTCEQHVPGSFLVVHVANCQVCNVANYQEWTPLCYADTLQESTCLTLFFI